MKIEIEKLKSIEIKAVLHVLRNSKEWLTQYEIINEILKLKILKSTRKSLSAQVSDTIKKLSSHEFGKVIKSKTLKGTKTNVWGISKKAKEGLAPFNNQFSDAYWISSYDSKNIYHNPGMTLYGIPEKLQRTKSLQLKFKALKIDKKIKEAINELENLKKEFRKPFIKKALEIKLKSLKKSVISDFIQKHKEVLVHFLNYADRNEESIKKYLPLLRGFKRINLEDFRDLKKLREILPKKEKSLSKEELRENYGMDTLLGMELWESNFFQDLDGFNEEELTKLSKTLYSAIRRIQISYPLRASIVSHTEKSLIFEEDTIDFYRNV